MPPSPRTRTRLARRATALVVSAVVLLPAAATALDDPALDQEVEADEETVAGRQIIDSGHVDLGPRFIDGDWRLQARDDREMEPVWRFPAEVVFHLPDSSRMDAPDNPDFAFLGVEPGSPLYVIPQTQDPQVVWLGWNTQDPEVVERLEGGANLTLLDTDGPGEIFLFLQEGVSGPPNVLWDTTQAFPQDLWMEVNTHTHANWVFTEPGLYRLAVEVHADLVDDDRGSDVATLRFAVGSTTDPQSAFGLPALDAVGHADPEASGPTAEASVAADDPATFSAVLIGVVVGAVVLVAAVLATVASGRRTRAAAARLDGPEVRG